MNVVSARSGINRPPGRIDIPSAWLGAEMKANPDRWLISLAASEITELENAAESYLSRGKEIAGITRDSFPLPASARIWKGSRRGCFLALALK